MSHCKNPKNIVAHCKNPKKLSEEESLMNPWERASQKGSPKPSIKNVDRESYYIPITNPSDINSIEENSPGLASTKKQTACGLRISKNRESFKKLNVPIYQPTTSLRGTSQLALSGQNNT